MNPSVQPFHSSKRSARPRPAPFPAQRPPRAAFVSKKPPSQLQSAACLEHSATQPSYQRDDFENYYQQQQRQRQPFQPPMSTQFSFHPPPHVNVQNALAPITTPEALVTDMWRACPALCRSIRQDFDLNVIFHPALLAHHGETFLRLAASQIAMQNQAAEMTQMRNVILQKQRLLDVNTASTEDLQQKLVAQQSELKEIRDLLQQQSQSLTNPDAGYKEQARGNGPRENNTAFEVVPSAPVTPALTVTAIDKPIHNFYSRSATLAPLKVSFPPDDVNKHDEKYGYGHAETKGPAIHYGHGEEDVRGSQVGLRPVQPPSAPPMVSTSPVFEPIDSSAQPIVSISAKEQTASGQESRQHFNKGVGINTLQGQTSDTKDMTTSATITIMKREDRHEPAFLHLGKMEKATNSETPKQQRGTAAVTLPLTNNSPKHSHQSSSTVQQSKLPSYAAAVRATPETLLNEDSSKRKQGPTTSLNPPALDLGFTLEPLPKPTAQQVQSQQQQAQPTDSPDSFQTPATSQFDFEEWKQRKIAAGTWQDRTMDRSHTQHHQQQRPYHNSTYRGRGLGAVGRFNDRNNENSRPGRTHHNVKDNFRSGAMKQEGWK